MARLALILLVLTACSGAHTNNLPDGGTHDAGNDGGEDAGVRCNVPAPPACTAAAVLDQTFPIDAVGKYEILSTTAFDGTLWIAYNRGDTSGATNNLQVWLTRLGCDGGVLLAPVPVSTDQSNDVNPMIAVSDGVVLVAWLSDSGVFPNNLSVKYRLYGAADAAPLSTAELTLQTTRDGAAAVVNMLDPSVAPLPGGGFVIGGTRSTADETAYQAFAQRIDAAGGVVGATIDIPAESDVTHNNAVVTADPEGTLYLAWAREPTATSGALPMHHTSVPVGSSTPATPSELWHQTLGTYPTIASGLASCWRPYLALEAPVSTSQEVMVLDATRTDVTKAGLEIYVSQTVAVGPHVAASLDGGAVAWLAETATNPVVFVQRFTYDGTNWQVGKRVQVPPVVKFAIRPPSLTHVAGNTYLVTWTEGSGAETASYARLVSLDD